MREHLNKALAEIQSLTIKNSEHEDTDNVVLFENIAHILQQVRNAAIDQDRNDVALAIRLRGNHVSYDSARQLISQALEHCEPISEDANEWMTVPEFARYVSLGEDKIRRWCKQDKFHAEDVKYVEGRQYRLHRDSLRRLRLGRK